jgi:hypothetical protein
MTILGITPDLDTARQCWKEEPGERKCLTQYLGVLLQSWEDGDIADSEYITEMNEIVEKLNELDPVFVSGDVNHPFYEMG